MLIFARRKINRESLAWAGGFFSGEGSTFVFTNAYVRVDGRRRKYIHMAITNTNVEALKKFKEAVLGLGTIYQADCHRKFVKPQWQWTAKSYKTTMAVIGLIFQFLTVEKRNQIRRVQQDCNGW